MILKRILNYIQIKPRSAFPLLESATFQNTNHVFDRMPNSNTFPTSSFKSSTFEYLSLNIGLTILWLLFPLFCRQDSCLALHVIAQVNS